jgi:hypothetical protein
MSEFSSLNGYTVKDVVARNIAKGRNQSVAFNNYLAMVTALNSLGKDEYKTGQNIYIGVVGVPDLWVYSVEEEANTFEYASDEDVVEELNTNVTIQCGYYKLAMLEGQKVDLTTYDEAIREMESKVDECFQSVSNGKTLVASAITDKGVTTSSDATFETMANNIGAIPVGKCISLGNGTSFDVKTVCANNGIDYTKLTANNFIVGVSSIPTSNSTGGSGVSFSSGWGYVYASGFTVKKTYNNGVLTISGNSQSVYAYDTVNKAIMDKHNKTQTATCFAYLVYTG